LQASVSVEILASDISDEYITHDLFSLQHAQRGNATLSKVMVMES